jgi:hypothetical protein
MTTVSDDRCRIGELRPAKLRPRTVGFEQAVARQPVLECPPALSRSTGPFSDLLSLGRKTAQKVLDEAGLLVVNPSLPGDLRIGRFEIGRREVKLPVCTGQ